MKLWNNVEKKWLDVTTIYFNNEGEIIKIVAHEQITDYNPLKHGWFDIEGDDLLKVSIKDTINHNTSIYPFAHKAEKLLVDADLSVRATNVIKHAIAISTWNVNVRYDELKVKDLEKLTAEIDFFQMENCGRKTIKEIDDLLYRANLRTIKRSTR